MDYVTLVNSFTIPAGSWTATLPVTPLDDALVEGPETVTLTLQSNPAYSLAAPTAATVTINDDEPMELVVLPNRVLQFFQWEHRTRVLWTDGRAVPSGENLENLGPAWYGHSVGQWKGDTLVVNTVGLDERAWLDNDGNPKSFHARIEETWRRVDSNTLEMQLTLYDPEYYTTPYVGSKKIYKLMPKDASTYFGWYGESSSCSPSGGDCKDTERVAFAAYSNPIGLFGCGSPTFTWDFKDGSDPETGLQVSHKFNAGIYDVTLTITNPNGSVTLTKRVKVANASGVTPVPGTYGSLITS